MAPDESQFHLPGVTAGWAVEDSSAPREDISFERQTVSSPAKSKKEKQVKSAKNKKKRRSPRRGGMRMLRG